MSCLTAGVGSVTLGGAMADFSGEDSGSDVTSTPVMRVYSSAEMTPLGNGVGMVSWEYPSLTRYGARPGRMETPNTTSVSACVLNVTLRCIFHFKSRMQKLGSSSHDVDRITDAISRNGRVAIFFSGPSCRACQTVKRGLDARLIGGGSNYTVFEADVTENADLADAYRVTSTPTMVGLSSRGEIGRATGSSAEPFNKLLRS